ncbi:MAG: hypothetical protein CL845_02175 [Crocinitomicaceae bacterium]|mgnify:CR=1 FL=1|nr:hypothetical protein [Crocinitomicaceae bacterium]|tara:strand:+ start:331 stop:588 length:258 start_codon:yes stop_codon:yes gene_type:complete
MRLPLIKHIVEFIERNDRDFIIEAVEALEHMAESENLKAEEVDVVGELISNLFGALEVQELMDNGTPKGEALNSFMKRVMGSVGQ